MNWFLKKKDKEIEEGKDKDSEEDTESTSSQPDDKKSGEESSNNIFFPVSFPFKMNFDFFSFPMNWNCNFLEIETIMFADTKKEDQSDSESENESGLLSFCHSFQLAWNF